MPRSTVEAEYCAASDAAAEARGLSNLLTELGYAPCLPVKIHTDNKGAQVMIENNASRRRTRDIDTRYHFVLDFHRLGYCTFPRVTSLLNYSDFGTKGVGIVKHSFCCHEIGMTTEKSLAFQIGKSTKEAREELKQDRENMRKITQKWNK